MDNKSPCVLGMVGLGVMGCNLLLNMAEQHFVVAGYDKDASKVQNLLRQSQLEQYNIYGETDIKAFIALLRTPRIIMMLVPAGSPVDAVINTLSPYLEAGDLIIDGGNSYFKDTEQRAKKLKEKDIHYLGVGISGGEEGARRGPSIMPGGPESVYALVKPIFEAVAAKINDRPCVSYLGPASAGHFVKMVHNGIEYGVMQLIAETYDLMKRGLGMRDSQIQRVYQHWNHGELKSYLLEITAEIFLKTEEKSDILLINKILGVAKQLGTGMWTSLSAMELQVPTPTIDIAVSMRDMSILRTERSSAEAVYSIAGQLPLKKAAVSENDQEEFLHQLPQAFYMALIMVYAQGMALLKTASLRYNYALPLKSISQLWQGGCIIRANLLDEICRAFEMNETLPNLLLDTDLSQKICTQQNSLRKIVSKAPLLGIPIPGLMSTLSYFDMYRSSWLPANLIQAQRDYFGAHTYERIDTAGVFHTQWV